MGGCRDDAPPTRMPVWTPQSRPKYVSQAIMGDKGAGVVYGLGSDAVSVEWKAPPEAR